MGTKSISLAELDQLLKNGNNISVIDVRSEEEYKEKHIPFAINLPIAKLESGKIDPEFKKTIVTVCGNGGGRSERAADFIKENYGSETFFLDKGTFGWLENENKNAAKKITFIQNLIQKGHLPGDTEDEKLKKSTLLIMAFPFALAGLMWGTLYFYNGLLLPGSIPFCYGLLSLISVSLFLTLKNFKFFRFSQIFMILLLPFFLQISLGGFISSSAVMLWSLICPLGALAFYNAKQSVFWFGAFILVVITAFFLNDHLPDYFNWHLPNEFINRMFLMNLIGISLIIYLLQYYFASKQADLKKSGEQKSLEIQEKNKEITDSINYAKRIQHTMLAKQELLKNNLSEYFILFKPKDIVSGDFYWASSVGSGSRQLTAGSEQSDLFYLAVCDSTGHGVPGAFMSLLNISFLNEAINERNILRPNEICDHVRNKLIESISQDGGQDGMDGTLVCLDKKNKKLHFAAAHNAPILVRNNAVIEFEADKMPIGKGERADNFKQQTIDVEPGDQFYLYTDGYTDQFGGAKGKKFKYRQMKALLQSICNQSLAEQKKILDDIINNWKGDLEQTDDILIIGFKI
jgi:serine phosphatase RsbU (regulator of sigma subunit)/rhodanese-related sulfurtransferase